MRRRTASHDLRRLPVRLRLKAQREIVGLNTVSSAKSCRRKRRRPKNITEFFGKRSNNANWLATHLWHAKRAHMMQIWGSTIAMSINEKSLKASLRAAKNGLFIVDCSYYKILECPNISSDGQKVIALNLSETLKWTAIHPCAIEEELFNSISGDLKPYSFFRLHGPSAPSLLGKIFGWKSEASLVSCVDLRGRSFNKHDLKVKEENIKIEPHTECLSTFLEGPKSFEKTHHEISFIRAQSIVPGESDLKNISTDRAYAFVVDQSKTFSNLYWILVPKIWAIHLWRALIHLGAVFGGQKELAFVERELGRIYIPDDDPSLPLWKAHHLCQSSMHVNNFIRLPPAKRGWDIIKHISHPFSCPFEETFGYNFASSFRHYQIVPSMGNIRNFKDPRPRFKTFDSVLAIVRQELIIIGFVLWAGYSQLRGSLMGISFCQDGFSGTAFIQSRNHAPLDDRKNLPKIDMLLLNK